MSKPARVRVRSESGSLWLCLSWAKVKVTVAVFEQAVSEGEVPRDAH